MAKYKLENKELLHYLLFEAEDEDAYVRKIEEMVAQQFEEMPKKNNQYLLKKSLRKILRFLGKQIKYSGNKETEAALRICFCRNMKQHINMRYNTVLTNLYDLQIKKAQSAITKLHEDLQYDFQRELEGL